MANIRKVFNFREGVQVDETTFVVNGSLVGIGTSLPSEFFDVRNNSSFSGVITASNNVFISAASTFSDRLDVGTFRFEDGVVQATSGVVTFVGDGNLLTNIPTSQWVDVDTGIGVSSVYNGGNVGIATTSPQYELQVGDYAEGGGPTDRGVGINYGDIILTGVVTASSYNGSGQFLTSLNATNLSFGTVDNARIPVLELSKIPTIPDTKLEQNLQITGVLTALGGFIGSISPTPGDQQPFVFSNVFVEAGISTFFDVVVVDTLTATASTARGLTGIPDIRVGLVSANNAELGIAMTVARTNSTEYVSTGILTVTDTVGSQPYPVIVGDRILKVGGSNDDPLIGIGSADPSTSLNVRAASDADIELLADSGSAAIYFGNSKAAGVDRANLTYDTGALEIANQGDSDIILHVNKNDTGNGGFFLRRGNPAVEWLAVDNTGQIGIGISAPTAKLDVNGSTIIRNDLIVNGAAAITGGDLEILGGVRYNTVSGISTAFDLDVSGRLNVTQSVDISGDVNIGGGVTFNSTAGVSTAFRFDVTDDLYILGDVVIDGTIFGKGELFANATAGIATFYDLDVNGDLTVNNVYPTFIKIPDNSPTFQSSGISTFFNVEITNSLNIDQLNDFNHNTTTGITTFNELNVRGQFTPENGDFAIHQVSASGGISTFQNLIAQQDVRIDQQLQVDGLFVANGNSYINSTAGISTFYQLQILGGGINVGGSSTFTSPVTFDQAITVPNSQNFTTTSGVTQFNQLTVLDTAEVRNSLSVSTISQYTGAGSTVFTFSGANQYDINSLITIIDDPINALLSNSDFVIDYTKGISFANPASNGLINDANLPLGPIDCSRVADGAMYPPKLTTTERDAEITGIALIAGAVIYNTTLNKLQFYNGTDWETVTSAV
jgi:hypothetical protein